MVVRGQTRGGNSKLVVGWAFLTFMFFFLGVNDGTKSADEGIGPLGSLNNWFPSYSWQVIVGPFFVAAGLFLIVFLSRRLNDPRLWALTADR